MNLLRVLVVFLAFSSLWGFADQTPQIAVIWKTIPYKINTEPHEDPQDFPRQSAAGFDFTFEKPVTYYDVKDILLEGRTLKIDGVSGALKFNKIIVTKSIKNDNIIKIDKEIFRKTFTKPGLIVRKGTKPIRQGDPAPKDVPWELEFPKMPVKFQIETKPELKVTILNLKEYLAEVEKALNKTFSNENLDRTLIIELKGLKDGDIIEAAAREWIEGYVYKERAKWYNEFREMLKREATNEQAIQDLLTRNVLNELHGMPVDDLKGEFILGDKVGDKTILLFGMPSLPKGLEFGRDESMKIAANEAGWNLLIASKLPGLLKDAKPDAKQFAIDVAKQQLLYTPGPGERNDWASTYKQITGTAVPAEQLARVAFSLSPKDLGLELNGKEKNFAFRCPVELQKADGSAIDSSVIRLHFDIDDFQTVTFSRLAFSKNDAKIKPSLQGSGKLVLLHFLADAAFKKESEKNKYNFNFISGAEKDEPFMTVAPRDPKR